MHSAVSGFDTAKLQMYLALIAVGLVFLAALVVYVMRRGIQSDSLDLGAVSTRWLSELRRDEPWTRS